MAAKIYIAGVDHTSDVDNAQSISIELTQNGRGRFNFSCVPGYTPARFAEVIAYAKDGVTPIFGGFILQRSIDGLAFGAISTVCNVECVDFSASLDWCYVSLTYTATTDLQTVLDDMLGQMPPGNQIVLDATDYSTVSVGAFEWINMRVSDGLRDLCNGLGLIYSVSPAKILSLYLPGGVSAPVDITDATPNCREVTWEDSANPGITSIKLLCGTGTAEQIQIWTANGTDTSWTTDFPGIQQSGYATVNGIARPLGASAGVAAWGWFGGGGVDPTDQFTDGETITVGSITYVFQDTLTNVAGHVKIGGNVVASFSNFVNAVNRGDGAGTAYADATPQNADAEAWMYRINSPETWAGLKARVRGAAGNSILFSDTCARATTYHEGGIERGYLWGGSDATTAAFTWDQATHTLFLGTDPTPTAGTTIQLVYIATYPFTVTAGGTGFPEIQGLYTREDIFTLAQGQAEANSLLARLGASPRTVTIASLVEGWAPGQELTIDLTARSLDGTFAITEVSIELISSEFWTYEIKATELSVYPGSYIDQWRAFLEGSPSGSGVSSTVIEGGGGGTGGSGAVGFYLGGSRFHAVRLPEV